MFAEETNDKTKPGEFWHTLYYLGEVSGQLSLKEDEVGGVIYVAKDDLDKVDVAFTHKEILEKYFASRN